MIAEPIENNLAARISAARFAWQPGTEASREVNRLSVALLAEARRVERRLDVHIGGFSMAPFFAEGVVLTVDCSRDSKIEIGDVIVFECNGVVLAHRLLARKSRADGIWFVEKGDNQMAFGWVAPEQVFGRAVAVNGMPLPLSEGLGPRLARAVYVRATYGLALASRMFSGGRRSGGGALRPSRFAKSAGALSRILLKGLMTFFEANAVCPPAGASPDGPE